MTEKNNLVRAGGVLGIRTLMRSIDVDPEHVLLHCGITDDMLSDPDRYISYRNVLMAVEYPAQYLGVNDFGLRLADQQNLEFLGVLSIAIRSAATIFEAFNLATKFIHFHTPGVMINISPDISGNSETIEFEFLLDQLPQMPQATEHAVSHLVGITKLLSAGSVLPEKIYLRHNQNASTESYRKHLGAVPEFNALINGITVNSVDVRRAIPKSNPRMLEISQRYMMEAAPVFAAPMDQKVKCVLKRLIRHGSGTLASTANLLSMQPRTLQRRLQKINIKFERIRDEVRRELFLEYVQQPNIPLSHVSQLLGYADQSIMNRSCRRWFDQKPLEKREELLMSVANRGFQAL